MSMEHTGALALAKMEEELVVYEPTGATHVIPIATGRVSLGRAAELCETPLAAFMDFVAKHGVPPLRYSFEDLDEERRSTDRIEV